MIAAFDIGVSNLALCIMEKDKILRWEILNITSDKSRCSKILKNKKQCSKIGHYIDKNNNLYCSSHKTDDCKKSINKDSLYDYGVNMYKLLDNIPELPLCDKILIENQPVLTNPTIKTISIILFSYFINKNPNIHFINAITKLNYDKETTKSELNKSTNKYKTRKELSIKYANDIIKKVQIKHEILSYYLNHKKKDDLADALLYCYNELNN